MTLRVRLIAGAVGIATLLAACTDDKEARSAATASAESMSSVVDSEPGESSVSTGAATTSTSQPSTNTSTSAPVTSTTSPPSTTSTTLPLSCSQEDLRSSMDTGFYLVLGCAEGWSLLQMYPTCNGASCDPVSLRAVWGGPNDDFELGYNTFPFSYCRARVAADGAPQWILDAVAWPDCDRLEADIDYHAEPDSGALRRGDFGSRVALFQQNLIDGEYPGVYPADGYFGWNTERAVRLVQQIDGLPVTGSIDEATLTDRGLPISPCLTTTADGDRVVIVLAGQVKCDEATVRWNDFVARHRSGQPVVFGDGWNCDYELAGSVVSYAAAGGRCTGFGSSSFRVIAPSKSCPAERLDGYAITSPQSVVGIGDVGATHGLIPLIADAVLGALCTSGQLAGYGVFISDGVSYQLGQHYRSSHEVCTDLDSISFGDPEVRVEVATAVGC